MLNYVRNAQQMRDIISQSKSLRFPSYPGDNLVRRGCYHGWSVPFSLARWYQYCRSSSRISFILDAREALCCKRIRIVFGWGWKELPFEHIYADVWVFPLAVACCKLYTWKEAQDSKPHIEGWACIAARTVAGAWMLTTSMPIAGANWHSASVEG